jgi:hypothetical protein
LDKKRDTAKTTETGDEDYDQVNIEKRKRIGLGIFLISSKADIAILNEEDIPLPEKPEPRKHDEIRTTILMRYQNAIRPPGR